MQMSKPRGVKLATHPSPLHDLRLNTPAIKYEKPQLFSSFASLFFYWEYCVKWQAWRMNIYIPVTIVVLLSKLKKTHTVALYGQI